MATTGSYRTFNETVSSSLCLQRRDTRRRRFDTAFNINADRSTGWRHVTSQRISPGQGQIITNPTITNPYEEELANYLCIGFDRTIAPVISDFNLTNDFLQQLTPGNHFYIGKYDGRRDDIYRLSNEAAGVFVFVIEGAFEVQNRLLHPRDGLVLWDLAEVEFEALSNEAMLMLIEVYH